MVEVFKILQFKLKDWIIFKKLFTNINKIIDEIVIECNPEGLKFKGIDKSHVCFFSGVVPKNSFDDYFIDEILDLHIDLQDFVNILKRGKSKDCLIFTGYDSTFEVTFKSNNERTFVITQIDMESNTRDLPPMNFSINFEIDFEFINDCLKDAVMYSNIITIVCDGENLILKCEGVKGELYTNKYYLDRYVGDCSATYSVDWLLKIFDTKLSSTNLNIEMDNDYPLLVTIEEQGIIMKYLLAPRLNND